MKPKFTRKFATKLFYVSLFILAGITITYVVRYGILGSSMWQINHLSRLATILVGSVGIIITFTGVILYFSVLYKNNFTAKLTLSLNNFIFFLEHHKVDNPKSKLYLENNGLELISETYKYLRKGFSPNKDFDLNDIDLSSILYSNMIYTYGQVFVRYFQYIDHILNLIYESEIGENDKKEYYNTLKLNLSPNTLAPLLYYYNYKLDTLDDKILKSRLSKIIKESNIFNDFNFKIYLLNEKDKSIFLGKIHEYIS